MADLQEEEFKAKRRVAHPRNIKCAVECDDGANDYCLCSRRVELAGECALGPRSSNTSVPLSKLTADMPSSKPIRQHSLVRRIVGVVLRVVAAFVLALLVCGVHLGVAPLILSWLIICVWLEIISFRFAITRK